MQHFHNSLTLIDTVNLFTLSDDITLLIISGKAIPRLVASINILLFIVLCNDVTRPGVKGFVPDSE